MDGLAGRPADNPHNSDRWGVDHQTVPQLMVPDYWQPGPPIWQWFSLDPDPDLMWRSSTVAHASWGSCLGWGTKRAISLFGYYADQLIYFGRMRQSNPLIVECVRLKIVDVLLTLTQNSSKQSMYTWSLDAMNRILITDIQHCVSK